MRNRQGACRDRNGCQSFYKTWCHQYRRSAGPGFYGSQLLIHIRKYEKEVMQTPRESQNGHIQKPYNDSPPPLCTGWEGKHSHKNVTSVMPLFISLSIFCNLCDYSISKIIKILKSNKLMNLVGGMVTWSHTLSLCTHALIISFKRVTKM